MSPNSLRKHRNAQHLGIRFVCPHCAARLNKKETLKNHLVVIHKDTNQVDDSCRQTFPELATLYADYTPQKNTTAGNSGNEELIANYLRENTSTHIYATI